MKKKIKFSAFEVSNFLDNEAVIAEYFALAEKEGNLELFLRAKADVAKARLMNNAKNHQ